MPEIFGRVPLTFGGGFAADAANIFFGTYCVFDPAKGEVVCGDEATIPFSGLGLLTQSINIQYQQPINRIYEVGGDFEYYIAGRPQGNLAVGRIVGPRPITIAFYTLFGNVCYGPNTALLFAGAAGCNEVPALGGENGFMFMVSGAILQSIGVSVAAQDMVINEQLSFMFISLLIPDKDGVF